MSMSNKPRAFVPLPGCLSVVALATVLGACGSGQPMDEPGESAFEQVFTPVRQVHLQESDQDPIGTVAALRVWNGDFVVADEIQSNLKVFDPAGRLLRTIGRAGDGPGEFRRPFAAAVLDSGNLAVLDRSRMYVSFFTPEGKYRDGWFVPAISPGGLHVVPERGELLIPAFRVTSDPEPQKASPYGMHLFTPRGELTRSFRRLPEMRVGLEESFSSLATTVVGPVVISTPRSRNEVHHYDLRSGREWTAKVGSSIYRPPAWPKKRPDSFEAMNEWVKEQMWVQNIVALDSMHYAVRFGTFTTDRSLVFRYAVADIHGTTVAVTDTTRFVLHSSVGGQVYGTVRDEEGDVALTTFRVQLPRLGRVAVAERR